MKHHKMDPAGRAEDIADREGEKEWKQQMEVGRSGSEVESYFAIWLRIYYQVIRELSFQIEL